jgi:hypothetical protein
MSSSTGTRCAIYEKIDALDEARSVADLVKRLKPILSELAYYAITGEAAVMETREEWHSQYADALYSAAASDRAADRAAERASVATRANERTSERPRAQARAQARAQGAQGFASAPPSNRPCPGDLPLSLRAIMNGSHPSFKEDNN